MVNKVNALQILEHKYFYKHHMCILCLQCNFDDVVLFMDVDLSIQAEFLNRVRRNVVQHKRVVFPIMYSQVSCIMNGLN